MMSAISKSMIMKPHSPCSKRKRQVPHDYPGITGMEATAAWQGNGLENSRRGKQNKIRLGGCKGELCRPTDRGAPNGCTGRELYQRSYAAWNRYGATSPRCLCLRYRPPS